MSLSSRRVAGALAAAVAVLAAAPPAQAGPLVASAPSCEDQALSQPFLPWLDVAHYTPAPGGDFEGERPWALSGGAAVVDGNEPFDIAGPGGAHSLRVPDGARATSPVICVGLEHPTIRFIARNTGSLLAPLSVSVNFEDAQGHVRTLPIGEAVGDSRWAPSLPLPVVANLLPLLPGERTPVSFTFAAPAGGDWQVDDVFVDPYSKR